MTAAQSAVLWAHIAAGVLALSAGLVAMATEKGGRRHVRAGRTYVGSMAVVAMTALPLAAVDADYFLFSIAVFSGYLVLRDGACSPGSGRNRAWRRRSTGRRT